MLMHYAASEHA